MLLPKFKLYNSNEQRNGKLAKLIFQIANVPYENISIDREEQWNAIRNETLPGTLPILEIDDVKLSGQTAICRHLAWRFGLSGQTATTDALLDMFADLLFEAQILIFGPANDDNDSNINVVTADDMKVGKVCNRIASIIEKQLTNHKTTYLIGEEITWVDLMTYVFFNSLMDYGKGVNLDRYPSVKRMYERISQITEFGNNS
ncbi:Glutathione S-transferase C-terminal domain family protein [Acanthocheilonema viteae]